MTSHFMCIILPSLVPDVTCQIAAAFVIASLTATPESRQAEEKDGTVEPSWDTPPPATGVILGQSLVTR